MKVTEIQADVHKISNLNHDFIIVKGPIQFLWGDRPLEMEEVVHEFNNAISTTVELKLTDKEIEELWDLVN